MVLPDRRPSAYQEGAQFLGISIHCGKPEHCDKFDFMDGRSVARKIYDILWKVKQMRLFHVDSSARKQGSISRDLTAYFVEELRRHVRDLEVDYLDLATDPLPHVTEMFTAAMFTPPPQRTDAMREALKQGDKVAARMMSADALLFGVPLYNFGMPSTFKAFIDQVVRPGVTHVAEADGTISGKMGAHRALVVSTRGLDFSPGAAWEDMDGLLPGIRAVFKFIGLKEAAYVNVQPLLVSGEERKQQAISEARVELSSIAGKWSLRTPDMSEVA